MSSMGGDGVHGPGLLQAGLNVVGFIYLVMMICRPARCVLVDTKRDNRRGHSMFCRDIIDISKIYMLVIIKASIPFSKQPPS